MGGGSNQCVAMFPNSCYIYIYIYMYMYRTVHPPNPILTVQADWYSSLEVQHYTWVWD